MFNNDVTPRSGRRCALNDVERRGWRIAVDVGVASDVRTPRLTKGRAGRHEEGDRCNVYWPKGSTVVAQGQKLTVTDPNFETGRSVSEEDGPP